MKKIVSIFVAILSLLTLFAGCQSMATYTGDGDQATVATLRIVTMDGEKLYDGKVKVVDDSPTVYMALRAVSEEKDMPLDIMGEGDSMFLNGVDDLVGQDPDYWMYYINKEMAANGIGTQALAEGDLVEFIYGDYNTGYVEIK